MDKGFWAILGLVALVALLWLGRFFYSPVSVPPAVEHIKGTTDTVFIRGNSDTVVVTRWMNRTIYVDTSDFISFGADSSLYDSTFYFPDASVNLRLSTFPAVDSFGIFLDVATFSREIHRVDTLTLSRIDTVVVSRTISDTDWYESWWFGSLLTGLLAIFFVSAQ